MQHFIIGDIVEDIRDNGGSNRGLVRKVETDRQLKMRRLGMADEGIDVFGVLMGPDRPSYWITVRWASGIETVEKVDSLRYIGNVRH